MGLEALDQALLAEEAGGVLAGIPGKVPQAASEVSLPLPCPALLG